MNPQVLGIAQPLVTIGGSSKPMTMQPTSSCAPGITRTKFSWSIPPPCLAQTCWVLLVGFNLCLQQLDELDDTKCYVQRIAISEDSESTHNRAEQRAATITSIGKWKPKPGLNKPQRNLSALSPSLLYTIILFHMVLLLEQFMANPETEHISACAG